MICLLSEQARLKKLKNKEDYKRRKEKDKARKLKQLLEKHKTLLKKELRKKKEVLDFTLKKEIRVCNRLPWLIFSTTYFLYAEY